MFVKEGVKGVEATAQPCMPCSGSWPKSFHVKMLCIIFCDCFLKHPNPQAGRAGTGNYIEIR